MISWRNSTNNTSLNWICSKLENLSGWERFSVELICPSWMTSGNNLQLSINLCSHFKLCKWLYSTRMLTYIKWLWYMNWNAFKNSSPPVNQGIEVSVLPGYFTTAKICILPGHWKLVWFRSFATVYYSDIWHKYRVRGSMLLFNIKDSRSYPIYTCILLCAQIT